MQKELFLKEVENISSGLTEEQKNIVSKIVKKLEEYEKEYKDGVFYAKKNKKKKKRQRFICFR